VSFHLQCLFASYPELMSKALGIVNRTIATHLILTHALLTLVQIGEPSRMMQG
jgi:hypothetical protein